jgi:hypothetical protein
MGRGHSLENESEEWELVQEWGEEPHRPSGENHTTAVTCHIIAQLSTGNTPHDRYAPITFIIFKLVHGVEALHGVEGTASTASAASSASSTAAAAAAAYIHCGEVIVRGQLTFQPEGRGTGAGAGAGAAGRVLGVQSLED